MAGRSRQVYIDDLLPGMVLAAPVLDSNGRVLLPAGVALSAETIRSVYRRGIERLTVFDGEMSPEELEAERQRIRSRLDHLFRRCPANEAARVIRRVVLDYRIGDQV